MMRVVADEGAAKRLASILAETFDSEGVAASAFEAAGGWMAEAHFALAPDREKIADLVRVAAGEAAVSAIQFQVLEPKDWIAESLASLAPVPVGRFVVHGVHDRARVAANQIGIEVEAALAFGTGHHGTTQGCLAAIDRIAKSRRPRHVLDVGTGTGVLAIAAARSFRRPAVAIDIDPLSVAIARENAAANRVGAYVRVVRGAGVEAAAIRGRRYDLVLANILLPVLQRLARPVQPLLRLGAIVILSGLLPEQANAALAVWRAQGLILLRRDMLDGWATLTLSQPNRIGFRKKKSARRIRR